MQLKFSKATLEITPGEGFVTIQGLPSLNQRPVVLTFAETQVLMTALKEAAFSARRSARRKE